MTDLHQLLLSWDWKRNSKLLLTNLRYHQSPSLRHHSIVIVIIVIIVIIVVTVRHHRHRHIIFTLILQKAINNAPFSLATGCELFTRFVTKTSLDIPNFNECKKKLIDRGDQFAEKSQSSRTKVALRNLVFFSCSSADHELR